MRFTLLVVTVATASLYLFQSMWFALRGKTFLEVLNACLPTGADQGDQLFGVLSAEIERQSECRSGVSREQVAFAIAGVCLVLALAWVGYRLRPAWRERRSHLLSLDPRDGAALTTEVNSLASAAHLEAPRVRVDAANPGVQAFAYGAGRDLRIGVTGGLVVTQVTDPEAFRAVVRHELGHVSNRDVPWTYYTVSVWWTFVAVALLPVIVIFAISDPQYVLLLGWRVVALAALVAIVGASLLRVRESYADARAAAWGSEQTLDRILGAHPLPRGRRPSWLRVHPSTIARRSLLVNPDGLFRADWLTATTTGLAAGAAFAALESVSVLVLPGEVAVLAAAVPVAILVAAVVVTLAWRVGLREAVRGGRYPLATPMGLGLGVGLAVAPLLSLQAAVGPFAEGVEGWVGYLVWAFGMVVLTALVVRWAADTARLLVAATLAARSPRLGVVVQGLVTCLLMTLLLVAGSYALLFLKTFGITSSLDLPMSAITGTAWLGVAPLVGAGAVLMLALWSRTQLKRNLASTARGTAGTGAAWFWRDGGATESSTIASAASGPIPRLLPIVAIGAAAGLTAGLATVAARVLGGTRDDAVRQSDAFAVVLGEGAQMSVVAAAVVATVVAAIVAPRAWWALALLAGGVGALVAATVASATIVASGCGLLPTMHPGCELPPWVQLDILFVTAANDAAPVAFFLAAMVGAIRWSLPAEKSVRATTVARRPSRWVTFVAGAVTIVVVGAWTGVLAARQLVVEPPRVDAAGYSVTLPAEWLGQLDPSTGATVFVTVAGDVLVSIQGASSGSGRIDGARVDVGGLTGWPIGRFVEGGAAFRVYEVEAPQGWHQVWVKGAPADLDERGEEIGRLLTAVRWE